MRKQYHSRNVDGTTLVWDIHRLVALSKGLPVKDVPLSAIRELDENYWFSNGPEPTCRSVAEHAILIEQTNLIHPIILCADGRVMDGMHRVCKAVMQGIEMIQAVQFATNPEPDYINVDINELPYDDEISDAISG